jgi:hypothetical protein
MANTIPDAATGSRATPLHRAFVREMLMAQDVEGYVANCRAIGESFVSFFGVLGGGWGWLGLGLHKCRWSAIAYGSSVVSVHDRFCLFSGVVQMMGEEISLIIRE